ncbi:hypothetical protein CYLTODRAFT_273740 [Cylindrobasidium torrendii FP15055 ss-10]|uniref:Uncharacterized protein n=1 Tax=Cylindrobasidium torrendii FP15055 ss-10 TaxID=1314674 RepID=A0A0D7BBX1_9AGAR|nr:hypothetical protein CYLTODRAFT_273740 [Cylindrobasidium torrendii FP15055 ss-10]
MVIHDIDLAIHPTFNRAEWINKGRKWADVPDHVVNAWCSELVIPDDALEYLMDPNDTVEALLDTKVPEIDTGFSLHPIAAYFCNERPSRTVTCAQIVNSVIRRKIPSAKTLDQLCQDAPQEWLNGKQALVDPRVPNARPLPFWVLSLFRKFLELSTAHKDYCTAMGTVRQQLRNVKIRTRFPEFDVALTQYPWNETLYYQTLVAPSTKLTQLLRPVRLCDDLNQIMFEVLHTRCNEPDGLHGNDQIMASRFYAVIEAAVKMASRDRLPSTLSKLDKTLLHRPKLRSWFVVLHNEHERPFRVNYAERTFEYGLYTLNQRIVHGLMVALGESFPGMPIPHRVINTIHTWLKIQFGTKFKCLGATLIVGQQADDISCIPATLNCIEHGIFGDPLWTAQDRWYNRMDWYTRLRFELPAKLASKKVPLRPPDSPSSTSTSLAPGPHPFASTTSSSAPSSPAPTARPTTIHQRTRPTLANLLHTNVELRAVEDIQASCTIAGDSMFEPDAFDTLDEEDNKLDGDDADTLCLSASEPVGAPVEFDTPMDIDTQTELSRPGKKTMQANAWASVMAEARKQSVEKEATLGKRKASAKRKREGEAIDDGPSQAKARLGDASSGGPAGISKGAISQKRLRTGIDGGNYDEEKRARWKERILSVDRKACFYDYTELYVQIAGATRP